MKYYSPTALALLLVTLSIRLIKILSSKRYRVASSLVLMVIIFYTMYAAGMIGRSKIEAKTITGPSALDESYYFDNSKDIVFFKVDGGYTIQTGSYVQPISAENKRAGLVKMKMPDVRIEELDNNNGKFYRVRVGKFNTLDEARDFADKNMKALE
ncbi:hypothetical protein BH10BAC5_BH10BAC5_22770 [soil metagenome]